MKKVFALIAFVCLLSGCSGLEVGGKFGIYRVDEKQDSSRTYRRATPLKCYFVNCAETDETQGS